MSTTATEDRQTIYRRNEIWFHANPKWKKDTLQLKSRGNCIIRSRLLRQTDKRKIYPGQTWGHRLSRASACPASSCPKCRRSPRPGRTPRLSCWTEDHPGPRSQTLPYPQTQTARIHRERNGHFHCELWKQQRTMGLVHRWYQLSTPITILIYWCNCPTTYRSSCSLYQEEPADSFVQYWVSNLSSTSDDSVPDQAALWKHIGGSLKISLDCKSFRFIRIHTRHIAWMWGTGYYQTPVCS